MTPPYHPVVWLLGRPEELRLKYPRASLAAIKTKRISRANVLYCCAYKEDAKIRHFYRGALPVAPYR